MAIISIIGGKTIADVGHAGITVIREKPELSGHILVFAALAEGIAIYGMLVCFLLTTKI